jgi:hypothetical protein
MTRIAVSKFRVWCTVDDKEFQVTSFHTSFEINAIPTAQIAVPVGRNVYTEESAQIHTSVREFKISNVVKVYMSVETPGGADDEDWPAGDILIFEGFLSGTGFRKSVTEVSYILHVQHWLVQLTYSSCLSADSHPMNPAQLTYPSIVPLRVASGGGALGVNGQLPYGFESAISEEIGSDGDLWGDVLLPWLVKTANENFYDSYDERIDSTVVSAGERPNTAALAALKRLSLVGDYKPLVLDLAAVDSDTIASAIEQDVQQTTYMSFANTTFWNKIIRDFGGNYLFSVVPRISDAYVAPRIGGIRSVFRHSIEADEYASVDMGARLEQPLKGVGIVASGAVLSGPFANEVGIGGWYSPDEDEDGLIMIRGGPAWLQYALIPASFAAVSAAPTGVVGSSSQPGGGIQGTQPDITTSSQTLKTMLDRYAEAVYVHEALKARQGSLTGKLRFDIAPGSIVKIEVAGDAFIPEDRLGGALYAHILRVTIAIKYGQASTSFVLSHIRTEEENAKDGLSIDRHPIYDATWTGTSLSDDFD